MRPIFNVVLHSSICYSTLQSASRCTCIGTLSFTPCPSDLRLGCRISRCISSGDARASRPLGIVPRTGIHSIPTQPPRWSTCYGVMPNTAFPKWQNSHDSRRKCALHVWPVSLMVHFHMSAPALPIASVLAFPTLFIVLSPHGAVLWFRGMLHEWDCHFEPAIIWGERPAGALYVNTSLCKRQDMDLEPATVWTALLVVGSRDSAAMCSTSQIYFRARMRPVHVLGLLLLAARGGRPIAGARAGVFGPRFPRRAGRGPGGETDTS